MKMPIALIAALALGGACAIALAAQPPPPGTGPVGSASPALEPDQPDALTITSARSAVPTLSRQIRARAGALGLAPPPPARPARHAESLLRQRKRLEWIRDYLMNRREIVSVPAERRLPRVSRREAAGAGHHFESARRHSLRLGLDAPPRVPADPGHLDRHSDRWQVIARWLGSRSERVRADERPLSERIPNYSAWMCIAKHEAGPEHGGWRANTGNGYYGGLQMDRQFQQTYAPRLYREKGTADNWTAEEQMRTAERARATRGFHPWPNTARTCGLI